MANVQSTDFPFILQGFGAVYKWIWASEYVVDISYIQRWKKFLIVKSVKLGYTVLYEHSSLAQSVEHAAVNRSAVGSSPTGGANKLSVQQPRSVVYDTGRGT